jgi:hypothetical protein
LCDGAQSGVCFGEVARRRRWEGRRGFAGVGNLHFPEAGGSAVSGEDGVVVLEDNDLVLGEQDLTVVVAEDADGEEGLVQAWEEVALARCGGQRCPRKLSGVS